MMPTGANSNIEYGSIPYRTIAPLTARLVDVPMSVTVPPRMIEKASGIKVRVVALGTGQALDLAR